ncbi:MAG: dTDP-4-dehydrorhamnose reductase [Candidatus Symbiobacter sp.]|nr:dTDP-4-dehydrorhamnose reductase [Candidatus Symbiobacter sp.]
MRKKCLILGAKGQIGSEICPRAAASGFEIVAHDHSGFDLTAPPAAFAQALRHIDVVINCAAYTRVDDAEIYPDRADQVNHQAVAKLAAAAKISGSIVLHLSTDFVFDGQKTGTPYFEADPPHPLNVYGLSKWRGEEALRHGHDRHIIVRTAWVFGPHGHNFVKAILRQADAGRALTVVNDQIGCPTPAGDIAACLVQMALQATQATSPHFGTYHYVGSPAVSWHDFAAAILTHYYPHYPHYPHYPPGQRPQLSPRSSAGMTGASRPAWSVLNCDKILRDYGIAQPDWRTGFFPHSVLDKTE